MKVRGPGSYMKKAGGADRIASSRTLSGEDAVFEFMLNALRLREPVSIAMFQQRTGRTLAAVKEVVEQAERDGLLQVQEGALSTTEKGFRYLNDLLERFLPEQPFRTRSV